MTKKGPLSKIEEHYIKTNPNMSNEDLAKELDRSIDSVSKVIRSTTQTEAERKAIDGSNVKHTSRGYVAMTGAESDRADSIPQKFTTRKVSNATRPALKG